MEILVTSGQMKRMDQYAIDSLAIPSLILMENAGRGTVELIEKKYGELTGKKFLVICGLGNNGGDGFVIARHLFLRGGNATIMLLGKKNRLKDDAKVNFLILKNFEKKFRKSGRLKILIQPRIKEINMLPEHDFFIDAIFGTGFKGKIKEPFANVISWVNGRTGIKISVDIPSGLNADNGKVENIAFMADVTATMGLKKIGLTIGEGRRYAGSVHPVNISIPELHIGKSSENIFLTDEKYVSAILPGRRNDAHKHSVGKIIILAGSRGMAGAATLASQGAMRSGAGSVILGAPKSIFRIVSGKVTEVMVRQLPETLEGSLNLDAFSFLEEYHDWADLLIFGPGFSKNPETAILTWKIISEWDKPMIVDADALNHISMKISLLKAHATSDLIITPHLGEFLRLTGMKKEEVENDRIDAVRKFSNSFRLTCILKGAPTIIGSDIGDIFINPTGNPGMATAGMGDVLTGLVGGLYAQGMKRSEAAVAAVFLHGLAGDISKKKFGEKSLLASDLLDSIPESLLQTERDKAF